MATEAAATREAEAAAATTEAEEEAADAATSTQRKATGRMAALDQRQRRFAAMGGENAFDENDAGTRARTR